DFADRLRQSRESAFGAQRGKKTRTGYARCPGSRKTPAGVAVTCGDPIAVAARKRIGTVLGARWSGQPYEDASTGLATACLGGNRLASLDIHALDVAFYNFVIWLGSRADGRTIGFCGISEAQIANCCSWIECTTNTERACGDGNDDVLDIASGRRPAGAEHY